MPATVELMAMIVSGGSVSIGYEVVEEPTILVDIIARD